MGSHPPQQLLALDETQGFVITLRQEGLRENQESDISFTPRFVD